MSRRRRCAGPTCADANGSVTRFTYGGQRRRFRIGVLRVGWRLADFARRVSASVAFEASLALGCLAADSLSLFAARPVFCTIRLSTSHSRSSFDRP